jgi:SAM-dependent methyltransferase
MTTPAVVQPHPEEPSGSPRPWRDVPASFAAEVLRVGDQRELIDSVIRTLSAKQQKQLMHPAGGIAAVLTPLRLGERVLVLGVPNSTLPSTIASFGASVTCADWEPARLRFARLLCEPALGGSWLELAPGTSLSFAAGAFDVVITDLDELRSASPDGRLEAALAEIDRVVSANGTIVLSTSSRVARWRSTNPRELVRALRSPWSSDAIRTAGFASQRVLVPYPSRRNWKWMIPLERLREPFGETVKVTNRRTALIRGWELLARLGLGRWIARDFYVVARRSDDPSSTPETMADTLEACAGERTPLLLSLSDARIAVLGEKRFVKVPLSRHQQEALVNEVHNTELARSTGLADHVLSGSRVRDHSGVPVTDFPLVVADDSFEEDPQAAIVRICRTLPADLKLPLADTAFWTRLASAHGVDETSAVGADRHRERVLAEFGALQVPVGPTHGDLHPGNLMYVDRCALLVDWNRFELTNPLFFDPLYALVIERQKRLGTDLATELIAFAEGRTTGALTELADERLGELTREQAAVILLLDRAVSYGESRRHSRPWTLERFADAARRFDERFAAQSSVAQ